MYLQIITIMIFFILLGIIYLQNKLLIIEKINHLDDLEFYIKNDFDKNTYIKIVENKAIKLRRQFLVNRFNISPQNFDMISKQYLDDNIKMFLFEDIKPYIEVKKHFINTSNEELIEIELNIYKNDKN